MNEKDILNDLQQIDNLLARCINPALTRNEHDAIRATIQIIAQRVKLSYELEAEKKENINTDKSET
jgi:hypothetical protein